MEKFTDQEITAIAARQKCSIEQLRRLWIVQSGKSFYVIGQEGEYQKPVTRSELMVSLPRDLLRVPGPDRSPAGIEWYKGRGDAKVRKSVDEFIYDYASHARYAVASMSLKTSFYDAREQTIYEAACQLANVPPVYHPQVAEWLHLFGGNQEEKLLDWLATLTRVDLPSCALLITGRSSAGKEMLAQGLARCWRRARAPTELSRVLEGFNEDLARCPLVFCDENMPATRGGKKSALADLKSMIASSSRTLSRKFLSNIDLDGAVRLILAANNNRMLETHEEQGDDEQESVAIRFLHIRVDDRPYNYLRAIGGRKTTEAWVAGGQLAEHAAWLAANRQVVPGPRLLVEGDATDIQRQLIINNKYTGLVIEWLVRHIASKGPNGRAILVGNGEILVNAQTIGTNWNQHIRSDFAPSTTRIGNALRSLTTREQRVDWPDGDKTLEVRYRSVNPEYLYEWSRQSQVSDPGTLERLIQAPLDLEDLKRREGAPVYANGHSNGHANGHGTAQFISSQDLSTLFSDTVGRSLLDS